MTMRGGICSVRVFLPVVSPFQKRNPRGRCMQEVGWHEEDVFNERFPKNSCNETRSRPSFCSARLALWNRVRVYDALNNI